MHDPSDDLEFDLRECHALTRTLHSFEAWHTEQRRTFELHFSGLSVATHPQTFLLWVRATSAAIVFTSTNASVH